MKRTAILTLMLALSGCSVYTIETPGTAATAPRLELSAWLVSWDPESMKSYEAHVGELARVYPEFVSCGEDGLPKRLDISKDWLPKVVALARAKGVKVLITMNNYANGDFAAKRVEDMLNSPSRMQKHIDMLLAIAAEEGVDGLDVDYESLKAADKLNFTDFVARLSEAAHARKLLVGIAVHPKESEPGNWDGPQAQDYGAIGRSVDFFHVMTYDFHWGTSEAGSIAPPAWVRSVMNFASNAVPKSKIEMGINSYGYDWQGKKAETMTWPNWQKLIAAGHRPERDDSTGELKLSFGNHEVWYPDAQAYVPKVKIAKELGLRGGAMWVLGQEDPAMWRMWAAQK